MFSVLALFFLRRSTVVSHKHLTKVVSLIMNVDGSVLGEGVQVDGKHRLRVELVAIVLFDIVYFLLLRRIGFVGDGLDAVLGLLHDVFVLQTLDVALLALNICVKERTSLKLLGLNTYFSAVASLESIAPSQVLKLYVEVQDVQRVNEIDVRDSAVE